MVRHTDGWSICFSGDTRPCQRLVEAARGCTLLIHEATFEPARMEQVSMTSSEAGIATVRQQQRRRQVAPLPGPMSRAVQTILWDCFDNASGNWYCHQA